ncbi:MAG: YeeE/YedE family protein [Chitinivibrionales bacterium]|nr:YeeE/YedE family protein [Chitinivibrionales bacterium]
MISPIRKNARLQLALSLCIGMAFGFLLHRGGVSEYDVIINQLLLRDFTVVKIMLTAVATGMVGIYALKSIGAVELHPKPGSVGISVIGGLIFGVGFAVLGLCPGTVAAAVGHGDLSALFGGVAGILIGAMLFAALYGVLDRTILKKGDFGSITLPQVFKCNPWIVIVVVFCFIGGLLWWIKNSGY